MTAHTRTGMPETSYAAAESFDTDRLTQCQWAVLRALQAIGPCTDERLVEAYEGLAAENYEPRQSPSGIRSRRAALVRLGLVAWTGERARLHSGLKGRVWVATP